MSVCRVAHNSQAFRRVATSSGCGEHGRTVREDKTRKAFEDLQVGRRDGQARRRFTLSTKYMTFRHVTARRVRANASAR